jgi:hypothetical protein
LRRKLAILFFRRFLGREFLGVHFEIFGVGMIWRPFCFFYFFFGGIIRPFCFFFFSIFL